MRKEIIAPLLVLLMLVAAGGYAMMNNDGTGSETLDDEYDQIGEWDVYYVDSGSDLPACGSATLGRLYYIVSTVGFETCTSAGWAIVDLTGPAGPAGTDGVNGTQGPAGTDGVNGTQGPAGADGTGGADGTSGASGVNGTDGQDGSNGMDGQNGAVGSASSNTMLTRISSPPSSLGCTAGGRIMEHGLDNGDGGGAAQNGVLESSEVDYTTTYCSTHEVKQVAEIRSGGQSSQPGYYMSILVGDTLYFDASGEWAIGRELWAFDTSTSSTRMVADINSGNGSSYPGEHMSILVGDTLYFDATDGDFGLELWAHDTSNSSTWQVTDIYSGTLLAGSIPGEYMSILVGDTLYFDAYSDTGNSYTHELWAHNTSNSSTWQVAEFFPTTMSILVGDTLYFGASDGITGVELWAHDTSNSSTWQVADINSAPSASGGSSNPGKFMSILVGDTLYFDALYFDASAAGTGRELWAHDTSNGSTWQVADINSGGSSDPTAHILVDDTLYFGASDGITDRELWAHNTSNGSTWQVADINSGGSSHLFDSMSILVDDTLYFDASDGITGRELWAHNTSNGSTWQVADINNGHSSFNPSMPTMSILVGDTLYFGASDGITGVELWAHDTSRSLTWLVADIDQSVDYGGSSNFYSYPGHNWAMLIGEILYFDATNNFDGTEIWAMTIEHSTTYD